MQQRTHENWDVRRYSPERERVIVLSSIFYYSVNTVIWCSEQENSSDCLSYKMDIWQSMCVTPAIYGIPETVITLIFQTIKTGSRKSTIWFEKQLEYGHTRINYTALWKRCPWIYAGFQSAQWQSSRAVNYSMFAILVFMPRAITFLNMLRIVTRNQVYKQSSLYS